MYGQKYRGYGQVGRHRHHPGGRGRAGSKDHLKIRLLKEGHVFGTGKGFTRHGAKREWIEMNVGRIDDLFLDKKLNYREEGGKIVVDLSNMKFVKILGGGQVNIPLKIILDNTARIAEGAREKIEAAGGEIVIIGSKQQTG